MLYYEVSCFQERFESGEIYEVTIFDARADDLRNTKHSELQQFCNISIFVKRMTSLHNISSQYKGQQQSKLQSKMNVPLTDLR